MSYARTAVTRMTLDMSRLDLQRSETVTLLDTNRRWEVTLTNGGAPFRLPPNWTAALTGIKPDGNGLLNGCSVVDGKIIYDFAAGKEIATCVGSYPVQFDVWDEVGELVASPKVYVNVLADVRPREGMTSKDEYGLLGEFISQKNDLIEDIDSNTKQINALKEKVTTAGIVTVSATQWTDADPQTAMIAVTNLRKGSVALIMPADEPTKIAATTARLSAKTFVAGSNESIGVAYLVRAEAATAPTIDLHLLVLVIQSGSDEDASVALIGVDAYGDGGETGGVDETAVRELIRKIVPSWALNNTPPDDAVQSVNGKTGAVTIAIPAAPKDIGLGNVTNERQYSAAYPPPYPVTSVNGKMGAVSLDIPSEASDVKADPAGTASALLSVHNGSDSAHRDIRLLIEEHREEVEALLDVDDETLDQLSEVVAYIKSNKTLIDAITTSKVGVTDIIDDLTTNVANKPLSAAQGAALKILIDGLQREKLDAAALTAAINAALAQAKESGEFDGASVTVASVTESTEGGGENVVTFSDGTSVTIKNGRVYMADDDYAMTAQVFAEMLGLSHVDLDNIVWVGDRKINYDGEGIEQIGELT